MAVLLTLALVPLTRGAEPQSKAAGRLFNVADFGAAGDGTTVDTAAINKAVEACAAAGGGQVLLPPGKYLSGTVHLRSHVTFFISAGASLVGSTNLTDYQQPGVPSYMPEARWGKWHRALLLGENLEDVTIAGAGTIDGNKVFDPTGEEKMRGPHGIVFVDCRGFWIRDVSIIDAANYAVFFQVSDDVEVRNVRFVGGWDGVHFRGAPQRWCHNVNIINCQFYTGDDSIAGRYWDNTVISGCVINSSCNGIRLIGPATKLIVTDCLFYGPGVRPHRTSGTRTNMLSGIILQPGAWDKTEGLLDDVFIADNRMRDVASPITIWTKPGNPVGRITVSGLNATGIYRSAISVESWSDLPITNVIFRGVNVEFAGTGTAEQGRREVEGPGVDARPLPAWGLYTRNVEHVSLEDVRFSFAREDARPVIVSESTTQLDLDNFRYTHSDAVTEAVVSRGSGKINIRDSALKK